MNVNALQLFAILLQHRLKLSHFFRKFRLIKKMRSILYRINIDDLIQIIFFEYNFRKINTNHYFYKNIKLYLKFHIFVKY